MATEKGGAEVKWRGEDLLIVSHALVGAVRMTDWATFSHRASATDADESLGSTLRLCLLRSRVLADETMRVGTQTLNYNERLAEAFGLSSTRALYSGMKNVVVGWSDGRVVLGPTRNRRGGHFEGFTVQDGVAHGDVTMPFSSTDAELGFALREALVRCL